MTQRGRRHRDRRPLPPHPDELMHMSLENRITSVADPYRIVPIVLPIADDPAISGKIRHITCGATITHKFLAPYIGEDGKVDYAITPRFGRQGYALLRDLFEAEGKHAEWAEYQRHLADIAAKKRGLKAFPADKLPAEVRRRQACGHDPEPEQPSKLRAGRA